MAVWVRVTLKSGRTMTRRVYNDDLGVLDVKVYLTTRFLEGNTAKGNVVMPGCVINLGDIAAFECHVLRWWLLYLW
jgi:hypothetical protein